MNLFLTERLACPRCGPEFGLILLADQVADGRVLEGLLGCPNCRIQFKVVRGIADLRGPAGGERSEAQGNDGSTAGRDRGSQETEGQDLEPPEGQGSQTTEGQDLEPPEGRTSGEKDPVSGDPLRVAALLGISEGPATLLLQGPAAAQAAQVAELVGGVEVVALGSASGGEGVADGVSRLMAGAKVPFQPFTFQGVLLSGSVEPGLIASAASTVAMGGRLVLTMGSEEQAKAMEGLGFELLLMEKGVVVGEKVEAGPRPLVTLRGI